MATDYTQQTRYLYLDTPLGQDTLLLAGFQGRESISELYSFQLELQAENRKNIPFEQIMGQRVAFGIEGARHHVDALHASAGMEAQGALNGDGIGGGDLFPGEGDDV